jgi:cytoskeletal protein CcmA (bactofilin family)
MAKNLMSVFGAQSGKPASPEGSADMDAAAPAGGASEQRSVMVLGKTLCFKGELSADEDLILMGRVEGTITHTASVTVGIGGVVIGDIHARLITVKGTVDGDLEATESIVITPTANVLGDLAAPRVGIVEGAKFVGAVKMTTAPAAVTAAVPATDTVISEQSAEKLLGS